MEVWNALRRKWLVTHNGVLVESKWALCRTRAEVPSEMPARFRSRRSEDPASTNWAYALSDDQAADPTYEATPCEWRDLPLAVRSALSDGSGVLSGRALLAHGCRFHLDDRGRAHPGRTEPFPPDPEIVDESALLSHAEQLGRDLDLVERGTLAPVQVKVGRGVVRG